MSWEGAERRWFGMGRVLCSCVFLLEVGSRDLYFLGGRWGIHGFVPKMGSAMRKAERGFFKQYPGDSESPPTQSILVF